MLGKMIGTKSKILTVALPVVKEKEINKKFELMLTRRAKAYSMSGSVVIAENWGVHAKLIYKYQILCLDHKR